MPSYLDMIAKAAKKVATPYPSAPKAPALPDRPTKIPGDFYANLTDFTAWQPWGTGPGHTVKNEKYIPMKDRFVKQNNYPAELQKLIDFGWKAGQINTNNIQTANATRLANGMAPLKVQARGALVMGGKHRGGF